MLQISWGKLVQALDDKLKRYKYTSGFRGQNATLEA